MSKREEMIARIANHDNRPIEAAAELADRIIGGVAVHSSWPKWLEGLALTARAEDRYASDNRIIPRAEQDCVAREYRARCAEEDAR